MDASISAAIIAGGRARRFDGQDKSRLIVEGRPLILRQLEILKQLTSDVFIVANDAGRFADLGLRVERDVIDGAGAIAGLHAALTYARSDRVIVVAGDLPFLHAGLLAELVRRTDGADGAWPVTSRGIEPLLACYSRRAAPVVELAIKEGRLRLGALSEVLRMHVVDERDIARFGPVARLLANVNTPDDYARVQ
jgi:molybdopterin-guanine dinucleotide biosynthesis protein A